MPWAFRLSEGMGNPSPDGCPSKHGAGGFTYPAGAVSRKPRSMRRCGSCTDAGLATDKLRVKALPVECRPLAAVQDREQPDSGEGDRHGEQRRIVQLDGRRALGVAERYLPDS